MGVGCGFSPHPTQGSPGRALRLAEEGEAQRHDGGPDKQGQERVASDHVPHDAHAGDEDGAGASQQAGGSNRSSFDNTSLAKVDCCQALARWLRELESNQRFQGESLAN